VGTGREQPSVISTGMSSRACQRQQIASWGRPVELGAPTNLGRSQGQELRKAKIAIGAVAGGS
jgi:hypothetical protein